MTRFEREISGQLGAYWQKSAEMEVQQAVKKADADAIVEEDGAIKWKINGNYIPDDFCEKLEFAGYDFDRQATSDKRDLQNAEFIRDYRERNKNTDFSEEEKAELDANNEPGTVIVNVITGRKYVTK